MLFPSPPQSSLVPTPNDLRSSSHPCQVYRPCQTFSPLSAPQRVLLHTSNALLEDRRTETAALAWPSTCAFHAVNTRQSRVCRMPQARSRSCQQRVVSPCPLCVTRLPDITWCISYSSSSRLACGPAVRQFAHRLKPIPSAMLECHAMRMLALLRFSIQSTTFIAINQSAAVLRSGLGNQQSTRYFLLVLTLHISLRV